MSIDHTERESASRANYVWHTYDDVVAPNDLLHPHLPPDAQLRVHAVAETGDEHVLTFEFLDEGKEGQRIGLIDAQPPLAEYPIYPRELTVSNDRLATGEVFKFVPHEHILLAQTAFRAAYIESTTLPLVYNAPDVRGTLD